MSILNVNQIQPVGSGQTVTISATNINTGSATVTAGTFTGNLTGNVTGNVSGIVTASSGDITLTNGNLVIGTSGKGIDFSATSDGSGTATSELLDDYEEGSWTPTLIDNSQANVYSSGTRYGYYTKVGRMVTATAVFDNATCVAGNSVKVGGLPYTITSTTTRYPGFNSHTTGAAISGTTIQGGYARPGETNFQLLQQNSFTTVNFSNGAFNMFLTFIYVV